MNSNMIVFITGGLSVIFIIIFVVAVMIFSICISIRYKQIQLNSSRYHC